MNRGRTRRLLSAFLAVALLSGVPVAAHAVSSDVQYKCVLAWPKTTWQLEQPHGMATDAAGNTYVADTGNDRVVKFDAEGRFVTAWGGFGTTNGKFDQPWDVACDPTGRHVYVTDTGNNRVQWFTVDGATVTFGAVWGNLGSPDYTGSNLGEFKTPHGITLDASGNVYVADTGNYRIQKFNSAGKALLYWGTAGSGAAKFLEPYDLDISPTNLVYVVDANATNCYVRAFDESGTPANLKDGTNGWGARSFLKDPGVFVRPEGIAVDDDGNVYVSDAGQTARVQKFSANGIYQLEWGTYAYGDSVGGGPTFFRCTGVDASGGGSDARILVADSGNDRLREFTASGAELTDRDPFGVLGSHGREYYRFNEPWDLACGANGTVYVADKLNHRVERFDAYGNLDRWTPAVMPPMGNLSNGHFDKPSAIAYDPVTQYVFVAEAGNNRVQRLYEDLAYSGVKWGAAGTAMGAFAAPQGIAVGAGPDDPTTGDPTRWVFVSDTNNNRIQAFDESGGFKATFGSSQLKAPAGLVVASDGSIYVVDSGNHRIVHFVHTNAAWTSWSYAGDWGANATGDAALVEPWGLEMDDAGSLYVTDKAAHQVKKFSAAGILQGSFGSQGTDVGQLDTPRGVCVSPTGLVYVADSVNDRFEAFVQPIDITFSNVADGGMYNDAIAPQVSFGSGAVRRGMTLDGQTWDGMPVDAEGAHVLRAWAEDAHGYMSEESVEFTIDMHAPTTDATVFPSYANQAVISFTAFDALSGVVHTYYRLDGGALKTGSTIVVSGAGDHVLEYWSADEAGNEEAHTTQYFAVTDTLGPNTTSDCKDMYVDSATITLSASDPGSGVATTYYSLDGAPAVSGNVVRTSVPGPHFLTFRSLDKADNWETTSSPVMFTVLRGTSLAPGPHASAISYGKSISLSAALADTLDAPVAGKTVTLWARPAGGSFYPLKTLSSVGSTFSCSVAPTQTTSYYFDFAEDGSYGASRSATLTVKVYAYVGRPNAPLSARRNRAFTVIGTLKPRHTVGSSAVKLCFYRYQSGKWVFKKSAYAQCSNDPTYADRSRYTGRLSLPYTGRWRVRAYHADTGHLAKYSSFDYLTVR